MPGITAADAQAHLDAWMAANLAVARNQSYKIGDRELTRADAADILAQVDHWNAMLQRLSRGGIRTSVGVPS